MNLLTRLFKRTMKVLSYHENSKETRDSRFSPKYYDDREKPRQSMLLIATPTDTIYDVRQKNLLAALQNEYDNNII